MAQFYTSASMVNINTAVGYIPTVLQQLMNTGQINVNEYNFLIQQIQNPQQRQAFDNSIRTTYGEMQISNNDLYNFVAAKMLKAINSVRMSANQVNSQQISNFAVQGQQVGGLQQGGVNLAQSSLANMHNDSVNLLNQPAQNTGQTVHTNPAPVAEASTRVPSNGRYDLDLTDHTRTYTEPVWNPQNYVERPIPKCLPPLTAYMVNDLFKIDNNGSEINLLSCRVPQPYESYESLFEHVEQGPKYQTSPQNIEEEIAGLEWNGSIRQWEYNIPLNETTQIEAETKKEVDDTEALIAIIEAINYEPQWIGCEFGRQETVKIVSCDRVEIMDMTHDQGVKLLDEACDTFESTGVYDTVDYLAQQGINGMKMTEVILGLFNRAAAVNFVKITEEGSVQRLTTIKDLPSFSRLIKDTGEFDDWKTDETWFKKTLSECIKSSFGRIFRKPMRAYMDSNDEVDRAIMLADERFALRFKGGYTGRTIYTRKDKNNIRQEIQKAFASKFALRVERRVAFHNLTLLSPETAGASFAITTGTSNLLFWRDMYKRYGSIDLIDVRDKDQFIRPYVLGNNLSSANIVRR